MDSRLRGNDGTTPLLPFAVSDVRVDDQRRFSLDDRDVVALARQAVAIERHYGRPMDIEWARDGVVGRLWILQARPETVQSRLAGQAVERFELKACAEVPAEGRSIGPSGMGRPASVQASRAGGHVIRRAGRSAPRCSGGRGHRTASPGP